MPTQGAVPAPLPGPEAQAARELLPPAEQVHLLPYDPDDRAARIWADEQIIAMSRCLGAVWNGSAPIGRDATGHLVAYARARSVPVSVVWPVGAGRRESDR